MKYFKTSLSRFYRQNMFLIIVSLLFLCRTKIMNITTACKHFKMSAMRSDLYEPTSCQQSSMAQVTIVVTNS